MSEIWIEPHQLGSSPDDRAEALMPLVKSIARQYARRARRVPLDELEGEACAELASALADYDPMRGALPPYVVARVRFRLSDYVRYGRWATVCHPRGQGVQIWPLADSPIDESNESILESLIATQRVEMMHKALLGLERSLRQTIYRQYLLMWRRPDIARHDGVALSTVNLRRSRALKQLRIAMAGLIKEKTMAIGHGE